MSLLPGETVRTTTTERYEQPVYEYTRPTIVEQTTYTVPSTSTAVPMTTTMPTVVTSSPAGMAHHHDRNPANIVEVRSVAHPGAIRLQKHYEHDTHYNRRTSHRSDDYDGGYGDHEHEHRKYLMHLGPNPTAGRGGGLFEDRRRRDFDDAMERRRFEAGHMRLEEATGFRRSWYLLENESLADRTRYPIKRAGFLQVLNLVAFLGALAITILTVLGVFRYSYQEVWDIWTTRFTPSAYVLAIWPVIYSFMALFVIYQILPYQRTNLVLFHDISFFFILACILQILTDLFKSLMYEWAAAGVITGLLVVLIMIYVRVGCGWKKAVAPLEYICVHILFGIWTGYISTLLVTYWATAAYAGAGWFGEPWTAEGWAILFMCVVVFFALVILATKRDGFFGLAVGWTLIAIARKNEDFDPVPTTFYITGGVLMVLSIIALFVKYFLWVKERRDREVVILKP